MFVLNFIITLILASVGMAGNILVLYILLQKHMLNTFNKLRAALAVFDLMVLGEIFLGQSILSFAGQDIFGKVFCYFLNPIWNFSQTASMFMTVAIAIERLRAISYPRKYSTNQRYRARKYVLSVTMIAVAFNLPKFNEYEPDSSGNNHWSKGMGLDMVTATAMRKNMGYTLYDSAIFKLSVALLIPISILVCSYAKIFVKIRQNMRRMERYSNRNNPEDENTAKHENMARIFAGVVITSLICNIPEMIIHITILIHYPERIEVLPTWLENTMIVRNFFIAINSSVNIVIYSLMSKHFRQECKRAAQRIIKKCKCKTKLSVPPTPGKGDTKHLPQYDKSNEREPNQPSEACTSTVTVPQT